MSTIPSYPAASALSGDEVFPIWQDGGQKTASSANIADLANARAPALIDDLVAEEVQPLVDAVNGTAEQLATTSDFVGRLDRSGPSGISVADIFGVEVARFEADGGLTLAGGVVAQSLAVAPFPFFDPVGPISMVVDGFGVAAVAFPEPTTPAWPTLPVPPFVDTALDGTVLDVFGVAGRWILPPVAVQVSTVGDVNAYARAASFAVKSALLQTSGILIVLCNGQSKSRGYRAIPPISTVTNGADVMLSGGLITTDRNDYSTETLVGLVAAPQPEPTEPGGPGDGETIVSGAFAAMHWLVEVIDGIPLLDQGLSFFGACVGVSGQDATTVTGTSGQPYINSTHVIDRVYALATTAGKQVTVLGALNEHGQADTSEGTDPTTFKNLWKTWLSNIDAYGQAKTGARPPVVMALAQTSDFPIYAKPPTISLAQAQLDTEDANMVVACPTYIFQSGPDGIHDTSVATFQKGLYEGKALYWRRLKGADWHPLKPVGTKRLNGRAFTVPMQVPVPPLRLSTDLVSDPGDYGFRVQYVPTGAFIALQDVRVAGDSVVLIAAADLPSSNPADYLVQYAFTPASGVPAGPNTGARGCLCDSDGDYLFWAPLSYRLDNYALHFQV